ncbi:MAG: hypothetical protein ACO32Z_03245 [Gemmatimonadaceae bacterium]
MVGAAALLGLTACGDALNVRNLDVPDVARVLFDAVSVEQAVAGLGPQLNNTQRASESVNTQAKIMARETFATVANFGMAAKVANSAFIPNELGNDNQTGNRANFDQFHRVQRLAFNSITAYQNLVASGKAGLPANDENRMRAFAYLIAGQATGYLSMAYDSVAVGYEGMSTTEIPNFLGAAEANAKAIEFLDSAVTIAGRGMSTLPNVWISGNALTQADFIRLARSYRARIRAAGARTPAERAALPWATIIADATNGITADHEIAINGTTGWSAGFDASQIYVPGGWHSVPMSYAGMADTSGAYQAWYATAAATRRAFLVVTPDKRWPQGEERGVSCTSAAAVCVGQQTKNNILPAGQYIRNRPPGDDVVAAGTGESFYDHRRYGFTQSNTSVPGTYVDMSKSEIDMLAAEGYIRTGNNAAAVTLINVSRVRNGLAPVTTSGAPANTAGSNDCVPKLPNGSCGSLLEAMKYEKRMETMFTGYMIWFTDSRGWGDLPQNTAIEWPVPYQEMQARLQPYYNGMKQQSAASTYGF